MQHLCHLTDYKTASTKPFPPKIVSILGINGGGENFKLDMRIGVFPKNNVRDIVHSLFLDI